MTSHPTEQKAKELSEKLYKTKNSIHVFEQKLLSHLIFGPIFLIITILVPFVLPMLKDAPKAMYLFFYVPTLPAWGIYMYGNVKSAIKNLNEIVGKATDGELSYLEYRKLKKEGIIKYDEFIAAEKSVREEAADVVCENRPEKERILKSKMITYYTLGMLKRLPILVIVILLCMPLVNVNLLFTKTDVSISELIFAKGEAESIEDALNASLAADCLDVPDENYKSIFSVYSSTPTALLDGGTISGVMDALKMIRFCLEQYLITVISLIVMAGMILAVVLCYVANSTSLFTLGSTLNNVSDHKINILLSSPEESTGKQKAAEGVALAYLMIVHVITHTIKLLLFAYIPLRFVYNLKDMALVTVSPMLSLGIPVLLVFSLILSAVDALYCAKNADLISKYTSLSLN